MVIDAARAVTLMFLASIGLSLGPPAPVETEVSQPHIVYRPPSQPQSSPNGWVRSSKSNPGSTQTRQPQAGMTPASPVPDRRAPVGQRRSRTTQATNTGLSRSSGVHRSSDARGSSGASKSERSSESSEKPQRFEAEEITLQQGLDVVRRSLKAVERYRDYTCLFVKRERVQAQLIGPQYMELKLRHQPYSVYMRFRKPESLRGQEVIYVEGQNDNKMIAHGVGLQAVLGTMKLNPEGTLAMSGNRHPITNAGMKRLLEKLLHLAEEHAADAQRCRVQLIPGCKVNGRSCTLLQLNNPNPKSKLPLAIGRLFLDDQWNVPLHFQAYDWINRGKTYVLVEEYSFTHIRFNTGLTDRDFDPKNPNYRFE